MKITFQPTETGQNINRQKTTVKESCVQRIGMGNGYALDISGVVTDNQIYKEHGKTTEEMMREAQGQDVAMTRDYMAVMSNCMSDEDFSKLQEDGYHPGDTDVETAVTIVDKIKASLLQAGISIAGYTDTLDMDTLTAITKDAGLAQEMSRAFQDRGVPLTEKTAKAAMQALEEAQNLSKPGDDMMKYMLSNEKKPVIQDLYMAQYSSTKGNDRYSRGYYQDENGYLSRKAEEIDLETLQPQINKVLEDAGLMQIPEAQEAAFWLIRSEIPLTVDTLRSYMQFQKISVPKESNEVLQAVAAAVEDGKQPNEADLTGKGSLWDQASDIWNRIQELTDEAADLTVEQGKKLTLRNLEMAQLLLDQGYHNITSENITARRQLEEVRLRMTISANRELLKSGYAIETTELEKVVEALKDVEHNQNQILFGGQDVTETAARAGLYEETVEIVRSIPYMPVAVVGRVSISESGFTLDHIKTEGKALLSAYQKANENYETFQTVPRKDLGDSIKEAFRNTETLLNELNMEATDANKRAVRILGYNSLDITKENILTVKAAEQALRNVVNKMTPAATLRMIREGKNPLSLTVSELDDYLSKRQQNPEEEQQKYSRFLYKLEQKKEITAEEKESYIGIYRLLRQVEKSDGAVIGSLVHQGAELSFKNLLMAVRTSQAKHMERTIDDATGTLQEVRGQGVSIDRQIEVAFSENKEKGKEADYYKRLSHEVYDTLDADKIAEMAPDDSIDLETFAEELRQRDDSGQSDVNYEREQVRQYRKQSYGSENEIKMLKMLEEPVTLENVHAMNVYNRSSAEAFTRIRKEYRKSTEKKEDTFHKQVSHLEECFNSKEEAAAAYKLLTAAEKEIVEEAMYEREETSHLDVKELGLIYKQISFMAKLADREKYDIPVFTENSVMALHVEIIHSGEKEGMIEASMDTEHDGKISVKLKVQDRIVKGFMICSEKGSLEETEKIKKQIRKQLSDMGFESEDIRAGFRADLNTGFSSEQTEKENTKASTKELYTVAKTIINIIRKQAERG